MDEFTQKSTNEKQRQKSLWAAGIFSATSLVFFAILIYKVVVLLNWQFDISITILMPVVAFMLAGSIASFVFVWRDREMLGITTLFGLILLTFIILPLFIDGAGLVSGISVALLSLIIIAWVLPLSLMRRAAIFSMLVVAIIAIVEIWNPPFRVKATLLPNFTTAVAAFTGLILFLLFVVRMWTSRRLRNRIIGLMIAVLAPILVIYSYIDVRAQQQDLEQALLERAKATAISGAAAVSTLLEDAISSGQLTSDDLFNPNYVKFFELDQASYPDLPDNPKIYDKYHTAYDAYTDAHFQKLIDSYLADRDIVFAIPVDINGYLPTHNTIFSVGDGNPATDRTKRIFNDVVGITAARNTEPTLQQIYLRSGTGETLWDVSAPIYVNGRHWGGFRVAVQLAQNQARVQAAALRAVISSSILLALVAVFAWLLGRYITSPIERLTTLAQEVADGNLDASIEIPDRNEITILASTFSRMAAQLREFIIKLEGRVAERTHSLELAAEVGRAVSEVRALDVMLKDAVEIIRARFDLYYAQIYLVNPSQTELVLQAGTGSVGAELLERGHRLPLNISSINGSAAIEKRAVVISDTAASPTFRPNALLPDTRSEMAVPLLVGDKVVGVLDMQSTEAEALSEDNLHAYEALAGQLAISIQNASLLTQAEQARMEIEKQSRRQVRASWQDYLDALHKSEKSGFVFEKNQILPFDDLEESHVDGVGSLAASIAVTGEQLGKLVVELDQEKQTTQTVELVNIVARQVAQQIENLRLLDSAERYRFEAEEAARRLTREGWEEYFRAKSGQNLSYLYDLKDVKPYSPEMQTTDPLTVSMPLKVRDETIGKLSVLGLEATDQAGIDLANEVAERLSQHIESLRLLEETQLGQMELNKRARQLAAVSQISTVSSRELDIQKMLKSVVQMTQRQFELYHAHVFTFNEETQQLEIVACGWKEGDEHEGTHGTTTIHFNEEKSLVARAARTREAVVVNDVRSDPGWLPNSLLPDTASELAMPLVIGDKVLGVLDVQSDRLNAFSDEDVSIQSTLASQVATALQNARSFARAQRQAERESMLNAISQKIQSATSVEAVLQIAARELGHALGAPRTIAQLSLKDKK